MAITINTDNFVITPSDAYIFMYFPGITSPVFMDTIVSISLQSKVETKPVFNIGHRDVSGYTFGSRLLVGSLAFYQSSVEPFQKLLSLNSAKLSEDGISGIIINKLSEAEKVTTGEYIPATLTKPFTILVAYLPKKTDAEYMTVDVLHELKIIDERHNLDVNSAPLVMYDFVGARRIRKTAKMSSDGGIKMLFDPNEEFGFLGNSTTLGNAYLSKLYKE